MKSRAISFGRPEKKVPDDFGKVVRAWEQKKILFAEVLELAIPAMEQTSSETMQALVNCKEVEAKERERIAEMLTTADYVKFAKFTPLQDENSRYLDAAYEFVNNTHQRVEAEIAQQQKQEEERKRQEEEQQRKEAEKSETPEDVKDK